MTTRKTIIITFLTVALLSILAFCCIAQETTNESHRHSMLYDFDDTTMEINGVYEGNRIENLIMDVQTFSGDGVHVFQNGVELTEGELEQGMTVKIYHSSELFGEYEISELLQPYRLSENTNNPGYDNESTSNNRSGSNSYGFVLPIDNMSIASNMISGFGSYYGGPNTSVPNHRGIDITSGGNIPSINGVPIRAVKNGTVEWTQDWDGQTLTGNQSWGNCVKISHSSGISTLYAHMIASPLVSNGMTVSQGQIIGYVGSTGNSTGPHLHLEVSLNGSLVNPEIYLEGAGTYSSTTIGVPKTFTGDVNGDGYDDIIEMRAENGRRKLITILGSSSGSVSGTTITKSTTNYYINSDPVFVGDVNGDGRTDVIVHFVSNGKRAFLIYTGKTNGSFNDAARIITTNEHDTTTYPCKFLVDDFNGDNKDDFLVQYKALDGTRKNLLYRGNASGEFDAGIKTASTRAYKDCDPIFAVDVNGDGCCDVVVHWALESKRQLLVYKGNTNGTFSTPINFASQNTHSSAFDSLFYTGDFNGDGYGDFLVHWSPAGGGSRNLLLYRGKSTGSFETGIHTYTSETNIASDPILIGDVDGDSIDDVIVEYNSGEYRAFNVYAGSSSGSFSSAVATVTYNRRNPNVFPARIMNSDVTNDGRTDAVVIWRNGDDSENVIVYKGKSTKTFSAGMMVEINENYYFEY